MIADRDAAQGQFARFVGHADEREIGGSAADVADKQCVASLNIRRQTSPMSASHAYSGRLRLLEQDDFSGRPASSAASRVSSRALASNEREQ